MANASVKSVQQLVMFTRRTGLRGCVQKPYSIVWEEKDAAQGLIKNHVNTIT